MSDSYQLISGEKKKWRRD